MAIEEDIAAAPTRAVGKRISDPELVALASLDEIFATLDPGEADRCLYWLTLRYGSKAPTPKE